MWAKLQEFEALLEQNLRMKRREKVGRSAARCSPEHANSLCAAHPGDAHTHTLVTPKYCATGAAVAPECTRGTAGRAGQDGKPQPAGY